MSEPSHPVSRVDVSGTPSPNPEGLDKARLIAEFDRVMRAYSEGLMASLTKLSALDYKSKASLIVPGTFLLILGGLLVLASFVVRALPGLHLWGQFSTGDFLGSLAAGCLLLLTGVFLFLYQYRTEQLGGAVVESTTEVAQGLVAVLGPDMPRVAD